MSNYIITIARGMGSGGSHVARNLSSILNIPYYDEEILEMASDYSGINEQYFFEGNERIRKGQLAINNSKGVYTGITYGVDDKQYLSNENLFNFQAMVIKELAIGGKQSCIILGKAANRIIGSLKNVVKVNIQAPDDYCIKKIMERQEKGMKEAREIVLTTNKYRRDYYKYYMGAEWNDPREYDLSINTANVGEAYAAEMIIQLLKERKLIQ